MIFLSFALLIAAADPDPADAAIVAKNCGGEIQHDEFAKLSKTQQKTKLSCFTHEAAKRFNLKLPSKVDDATLLKNVTANGTMLTYHYVVNIAREDLRSGALEAFKPTVKAKVCAAEDMHSMIESGASYQYEWTDRNGKPIGQLTITNC